MGLSPLRNGVEVRESVKSLCSPLGVLTAGNVLDAGVADGAGAVLPLTGVNPLELIAVKPDEIAERDSSGGAGTASTCIDAFSAAEALMVGESRAFAVGVPCTDLFSGE